MYATLEAFRADAVACGAAGYPDSSLEPQRIEAAYRIYRHAAAGTKLENLHGRSENFGVTIVGRLALRAADGKWVPSDESFPSIDETLRENLGTMGDRGDGHGAILDAAHWCLLANDAWLLGGIHARTEFHFASPLRWSNLWEEARARMTVTARELIGIVSFGYRIHKTALEPIGACTDARQAEAASLPAYRTALDAAATAAGLRAALSEQHLL